MNEAIAWAWAIWKLIEQYGLGIVWLILILYFFFKLIWLGYDFLQRLLDKNFPKQNLPGQKKTMDQIKALNEFEIKVNWEVNRLIDTIRGRYDADRVAIMQYHNWTTYLSWSHNVKVSMTHEAVKMWIWNIIRDMQDIPSALFTHANSNLLKWEDTTIIYDTDTEEWNSDSWVVATYKSIWYKSVYAIAIRKWWHLVGKIVVWFFNTTRLDDDEIEDIKNTVQVIESIINL